MRMPLSLFRTHPSTLISDREAAGIVGEDSAPMPENPAPRIALSSRERNLRVTGPGKSYGSNSYYAHILRSSLVERDVRRLQSVSVSERSRRSVNPFVDIDAFERQFRWRTNGVAGVGGLLQR